MVLFAELDEPPVDGMDEADAVLDVGQADVGMS